MQDIIPVNFTDFSNKTVEKTIGTRELINLMPVSNGTALKSIMGFDLLFTTPGNFQGGFQTNDDFYFVQSGLLCRADLQLTTFQALANLGVTQIPFKMAFNNNSQLILVSSQANFIYDELNDVLTPITGDNFGVDNQPTDVAFLDGFFIINSKNTNEWQVSELNDGTTWNANYIAAMETDNDVIVGVAAINGTLFLFGKHTLEIWFIKDNPASPPFNFPFQRDNNLRYLNGTVNNVSYIIVNDVLYYLGLSKKGISGIWMTSKGAPEKISPPNLDFILQDSFDEKAIVNGIQYNGTVYLIIALPTINRTFLFDVMKKGFCEIQYPIPLTIFLNVYEKVLAASNLIPNVFKMNDMVSKVTTLTTTHPQAIIEYPIRRIYISDVVDLKGNTKIDYFEIDGNFGQQADLTAWLAVSYDKGLTWVNKRQIILPALGNTYRNKISWRNLGVYKNITFKLEFTGADNFYLKSIRLQGGNV